MESMGMHEMNMGPMTAVCGLAVSQVLWVLEVGSGVSGGVGWGIWGWPGSGSCAAPPVGRIPQLSFGSGWCSSSSAAARGRKLRLLVPYYRAVRSIQESVDATGPLCFFKLRLGVRRNRKAGSYRRPGRQDTPLPINKNQWNQ